MHVKNRGDGVSMLDMLLLPASMHHRSNPPWCSSALDAASWQAGSSCQALQLQTQLQAGHDDVQASPVHGGHTPTATPDFKPKTERE
jgi:hypothetical protein